MLSGRGLADLDAGDGQGGHLATRLRGAATSGRASINSEAVALSLGGHARKQEFFGRTGNGIATKGGMKAKHKPTREYLTMLVCRKLEREWELIADDVVIE